MLRRPLDWPVPNIAKRQFRDQITYNDARRRNKDRCRSARSNRNEGKGTGVVLGKVVEGIFPEPEIHGAKLTMFLDSGVVCTFLVQPCVCGGGHATIFGPWCPRTKQQHYPKEEKALCLACANTEGLIHQTPSLEFLI